MTAYFDEMDGRLRALRTEAAAFDAEELGAGAADLHERVRDVETTIVRDVTICAEWPGCPEDIRDAIHEVVLRYSVEAQPSGISGPDYEMMEAHVAGLARMSWELHTVFHDLARLGLERFGDDPRVPVSAICGDGDARREKMRPVPIAYWRRHIEMAELNAAERASLAAMLGQNAYDYALRQDDDATKAEAARAATIASLMADAPAEVAT